jgi:hypothetical protein
MEKFSLQIKNVRRSSTKLYRLCGKENETNEGYTDIQLETLCRTADRKGMYLEIVGNYYFIIQLAGMEGVDIIVAPSARTTLSLSIASPVLIGVCRGCIFLLHLWQ